MKKALLLVTVLTISCAAFSQNFVYSPTQHVVEDVQAENFSLHEMQMTTPTPAAIQFNWELISNSFPAEWSYSLCDQGGCYVGIPPSGTMTAITQEEAENGKEGFFKINLTAGYNYGRGVVKLYVYDNNDYTRGDTVSFDIDWSQGASALNETSQKMDINIYPNPASSLINLSNLNNDIEKIALFNILGESVYSENVSAKEKSVDVGNLNRGSYFLTIYVKDGTVITEKIVLN
jgi:hypothetical protein